MSDTPEHLFELGRILATPGALRVFEEAKVTPLPYILRHVSGDWGDLGPEDRQANLFAVTHGSRILSAYHLSSGVKVWIITEADRSSTTILLPEEY